MTVELSGFELETIFKQIPLLAGHKPEDFQINPLVGYTNLNFHLKNDEYDWVLRIPKQATNQYINRSQEAQNADCAYALGIAADCLWRDQSGLSLTRTILNSRPLNKPDLKNEPTLKAVVKIVGRLHKSEKSFQGTIDLAALITRYFKLAPGHQQKLINSGYKMALGKIKRLSNQKLALVPSHNDLVLENILIDATEQAWLIDWEYSSMASPYWDLATLCNAANFDHPQSALLLDEYQKTGWNLNSEILEEYRFVIRILSISWMAAFTDVDIEEALKILNDRVTDFSGG
jgi:thiamine kinase-like enzyme